MRINKIKAFTLVEVVVVMILITILVNIGFVLYLNGQKLLNNFQTVNEEMNALIQLQKQIHLDFISSELIKGNHKEISFHRKDGGIIIYEIHDGELKIKKNGHVFDQQALIENVNTIYLEQYPELIARIDMTLNMRKEKIVLSFKKEYTNKVLFELSIDGL